jgi:hypothetical protein
LFCSCFMARGRRAKQSVGACQACHARALLPPPFCAAVAARGVRHVAAQRIDRVFSLTKPPTPLPPPPHARVAAHLDAHGQAAAAAPHVQAGGAVQDDA